MLLSEVPTPVLTYCRSGARCAKLWALSEAGKQNVNTLVETVDKAGLSIVDGRTPFVMNRERLVH